MSEGGDGDVPHCDMGAAVSVEQVNVRLRYCCFHGTLLRKHCVPCGAKYSEACWLMVRPMAS